MGANKKWVRDSSQHEASLKTPRMPKKKTFIRQKKKTILVEKSASVYDKDIFPVKRGMEKQRGTEVARDESSRGKDADGQE